MQQSIIYLEEEHNIKTPVIFLIFNRPDVTRRVFDEIAKAKPSKLLVVADGPRKNHPDDLRKCYLTRQIIEEVSWDCEVHKNYSDINLGCGIRVATGISWAFEKVEEAIILEDDCLPNQAFFRFCEELLERYQYENRIVQISGNNFQLGQRRSDYSYFFSVYPICWGWATWKRAWNNFDLKLKQWHSLRNTTWLFDLLKDKNAAEYFKNMLDYYLKHGDNPDTWDYQWEFSCWLQNGLSICPAKTLVTNLGCREDATHTKSAENIVSKLPTEKMSFPLIHPPKIVRDIQADQFISEKIVAPQQLRILSKNRLQRFRNIIRPIYSIIPKPVRNYINKLIFS